MERVSLTKIKVPINMPNISCERGSAVSVHCLGWRHVAVETHLYKNEFVEENAAAHVGYRDARHDYERAHHCGDINDP